MTDTTGHRNADPEEARQDFSGLEAAFSETVKEMGGEIHAVPLADLAPKMSVRLKCQVPLCEYYGVCRVCPPNIPGVAEFREALSEYRRAWLVAYREKIADLSEYRRANAAERKLADMVLELERVGLNRGFTSVMGLCVGGCKLCPECAPLSEPCRHPFKARPSPEGFGIDITKAARKAGVLVEWPPRETVTFLGLVFV